MLYTIENELLRLTVDTTGAEMTSVVNKTTGEEMLWHGRTDWTGRHAPILFPYTGKLRDGRFTHNGVEYAGGQHGFGRDMQHAVVARTADSLTLELHSDEKTRALFPFDFVLRSTYTLIGQTVRHAIRVENAGGEVLRFGFGYHPGFICPFDADHDTDDYEFRFDIPQSPMVQETPGGLCGGTHRMMENSAVIGITDDMFATDSICMTDLTARTLAVVEKSTGRKVEVKIEGFPYVLIWSWPTDKLKFVCIEPWHTVPDRVDASGKWEDKPCAAALQPGECWDTALDMTFAR